MQKTNLCSVNVAGTPDSGPLGAASALQVHLMLSVAAVFLSLVAGRL